MCCVVARLHFIFVMERCAQLESVWSCLAYTDEPGHSTSCSGNFRTSLGCINTIKIMYLEICEKVRGTGRPCLMVCRGLKAVLSADSDCWLCLPSHLVGFPRRSSLPTPHMKWLPCK